MNSASNIIKNNFTLNSNYLRYAIRLTLGCTLAVILFELLHLKNGYWVAFSVIACVFPTLGQSLKRTKQRILGTFIGMWVGILVAHSFGFNYIFIDILLPVFIFLTFYSKAYAYSLYVFFITIVTVLFMCLLVPGDWQIGVIRLEMTAIGAVIALAVNFLILPSRASHILPQQLARAKQSLQQYFASLCPNCLKQRTALSQTAQAKTYEHLQAVLETIKEYPQEYWHLPVDQYQSQSLLHRELEAIYQTLLSLEIHMPHQIREKKLEFVSEPLKNILSDITPLFTQTDLIKISKLDSQVEILLTQVREQRIAAARDLSIQTATFYEHMQLTIFLETLLKLLDGLRRV